MTHVDDCGLASLLGTTGSLYNRRGLPESAGSRRHTVVGLSRVGHADCARCSSGGSAPGVLSGR
jgi:hypothetical protein